MRASGASKLRKFWHFYILKLLFLSIFCRYIHWQITCIPWLNSIWGGKRPPKPPHQYASEYDPNSNINQFMQPETNLVSIGMYHCVPYLVFQEAIMLSFHLCFLDFPLQLSDFFLEPKDD